MLVYFAALLAAACVLYKLHPQREANRWAAFFLLFASTGGLAGYIRDNLLFKLMERAGTGMWPDFAASAAKGLETLNHTLTPYGVLVFALVYAERFSRKVRAKLKLLLLLPAVVAAAVYWTIPGERAFFLTLLFWAVPYYAYSCWLLLSAYRREPSAWKRREKLAVAVLAVPTLAAIAVLINVANVWEPGFRFFHYIAFFIAYSLLAGVAFAFGSGVLGVKVRLEKDPLESAVTAVSSGTAMLNHTIKNEIAKISMSAENVKFALGRQDAETAEQLDLIVRSADHMKQMVARIHGQMQEIVLEERPNRLSVLVEQNVRSRSAELERSGIRVETDFECDPILLCDPVHVGEVISNLVTNAMEAMPGGGTLHVRIAASKRYVELSLRDNGPGIPQDRLVRVLEPFYTTKKHTGGGGNFGLGLTYGYQVMQKIGGSIEVTSREGAGTVVTLRFPGSKRLEG